LLIVHSPTTTPSKSLVLPTSTSCVGTQYTIKSGDTCHSIAMSQGVSTGGLLDANKLAAGCAKLPKSGTLCISTNAKCKTRLVQQGDTCAKVADANKLSWTQVATWNRDFSSDCKRIREFVGYSMCISTPGGDWKNPSPSATTPTPSVM
jgi:hypothetical protein